MKKGFILPLVLIIMSMLLGVALVLGRLSEEKTRALKAQEVSYYSGKEVTIELDEEIGEKDPPGKKPFQDVINLYGMGKIEFLNNGHTKQSTNGRFANINLNVSNSCQMVGGVAGNDFDCIEDTALVVSGYALPSIDFGSVDKVVTGTETLIPGASYKNLTINGTVIFPPGVYYVEQLTVTGGSIVLNPSGNVKIYSGGAIYISGNVNAGGEPSQLLIINNGSSDTKIDGASVVKGFIYANANVIMDNNSEMYGGLVTGGVARLDYNSFIEYDQGGANKFFKENITEKENFDW